MFDMCAALTTPFDLTKRCMFEMGLKTHTDGRLMLAEGDNRLFSH